VIKMALILNSIGHFSRNIYNVVSQKATDLKDSAGLIRDFVRQSPDIFFHDLLDGAKGVAAAGSLGAAAGAVAGIAGEPAAVRAVAAGVVAAAAGISIGVVPTAIGFLGGLTVIPGIALIKTVLNNRNAIFNPQPAPLAVALAAAAA
jgi:hypothetical protein